MEIIRFSGFGENCSGGSPFHEYGEDMHVRCPGYDCNVTLEVRILKEDKQKYPSLVPIGAKPTVSPLLGARGWIVGGLAVRLSPNRK